MEQKKLKIGNKTFEYNKLKLDKQMSIKYLTDWDKWSYNYERYRNIVENIHEDTYILKILIWNVQSLNKDYVKFKNKIDCLRNVLNNNNIDVIFLIDANNYLDYINLNGYIKNFDGRNILFVKDIIKENVNIIDNVFKLNDMNFLYLTPNAKANEVNKVINMLKNNNVLYGDFNIKSHKNLMKYINKFNGEDTLQVGAINEKIIKIRKIPSPSDHMMVLIHTKKKLRYCMNLKLKEISYINTKKIVNNIIDNRKFKFIPKIVIKKYNNYLKDRDLLNNELIDEIINGNVRRAYKKYNYLWTKLRKEPFLGSHVNKNIEDGFKNHLLHKEKKRYMKLNILNEDLFDGLELNRTKSTALNYDYLQLDSIYKSLKELIKKKSIDIMRKNKEKNLKLDNFNFINNNIDTKEEIKRMLTNVVNNIIKNANNYYNKIRANTFFLIKNKKLIEFGDVRMIIIMPTFVKLFETIIVSDIISYLSQIIILQKYQWGGIIDGSTYRAMIDLRLKMEKEKVKGVLFLDMRKGYDSINFDLLRNMINKIQNNRIKTLLINWWILMSNLDIVINNNIIRRTRGIPMGSSLSPIIFVFYLHNIIDDNIKKLCSMYIDDIAMIIPNNYDINKTNKVFNDLLKELEKGDLIINVNKSVIVSEDDLIRKNFENKLIIRDNEKYLGREIKLEKNGNIIGDDSCFKKFSFVNNKLYWINFAIKRLIYNGALEARIRFKFYMWPTKDKEVRKKIFQNSWKFYKQENKYSYVQVIMVSTNLFRFFIDPLNLLEYKKIVNEDNINRININFKAELRTGINQVDKIVDKLEIDWMLDYEVDEDNLWYFYKSFSDCLWDQFKEKMIINYREEKARDNIQIFNNINLDSSIIKNIGCVMDCIFNHAHKNKFKMILFWDLCEMLNSCFSEWKIDNKIVKDINNFNIKKRIFMANRNDKDWENEVRINNSKSWIFINNLLDLEESVKKKINMKDKLIKEKDKSLVKFQNNIKLNEFEEKLFKMEYDEFFKYIDKKDEEHKNKYNSNKIIFKKLVKYLIIFDCIYCDKSYNNMNYDEIRLNFLIKLDDINELAEKIIKVIKIEKYISE